MHSNVYCLWTRTSHWGGRLPEKISVQATHSNAQFEKKPAVDPSTLPYRTSKEKTTKPTYGQFRPGLTYKQATQGLVSAPQLPTPPPPLSPQTSPQTKPDLLAEMAAMRREMQQLHQTIVQLRNDNARLQAENTALKAQQTPMQSQPTPGTAATTDPEHSQPPPTKKRGLNE